MRVITGSARGHALKAPRHMNLRPTPSRVKESLFSSLGDRVSGARVLDLFAGTGAFAIEALSRGATAATLVEKDGRAMALIEANLRKTHLTERARLVRADVRHALERLAREGAVFDLIFADPPYRKGRPSGIGEPADAGLVPGEKDLSWGALVLKSPHLPGLLAPHGALLLEHFRKEILVVPPLFRRVREFSFGDTVVAWLAHGTEINQVVRLKAED